MTRTWSLWIGLFLGGLVTAACASSTPAPPSFDSVTPSSPSDEVGSGTAGASATANSDGSITNNTGPISGSYGGESGDARTLPTGAGGLSNKGAGAASSTPPGQQPGGFSKTTGEQTGAGGEDTKGIPPFQNPPKKQGSSDGICERSHAGATADGDSAIVCDQLFSTRPFVRPPADEISGDKALSLYVAFDLEARCLRDRQGTCYTPVTRTGRPLSIRESDGKVTALPRSMRMMSNRNLFLIYRVRGTLGMSAAADSPMAQDGPTIHITTASTAILLKGDAIDGAFLGVWEGAASQRQDDGQWASDQNVPLRISFSKLEAMGAFPIWNDPQMLLADGHYSALVGSIDNWDKPVRASDGTCLPALSSLGQANPFYGASRPAVRLYRQTSLDTAGGQQLLTLEYPPHVIGLDPYGSAPLRIFHPGDLLQITSPAQGAGITFGADSASSAFHIDLHPVATGGGDMCEVPSSAAPVLAPPVTNRYTPAIPEVL